MKVVRNYLYNAGYQILALIVPLVTYYYISRTLSPEGVGANAFTNSIIQYFILFANLGIAFYGNREVAYVRDNKAKLSITFFEIQIVKTLMTILSYLFFIIFMNFYTRNSSYMWAQSLNLIAVAFDISWFYQGLEDFKKTVLRNTFVKIISVIAIFIFIKSESDVAKYIILLALSTLLGNLTLWPSLRKNISISYIRIKSLNPWRHFFPMGAMFIPQIATQVYVQLTKTMLGAIVGEEASGFYQYSDGFVKIVLALVTATGTVMLPHVSNAISNGNMKVVNNMLYKSFDFVSAIAFPMAFGLAGVSLTLAPIYYGLAYKPVGLAMLIESIIIILIGWSNVIGIQYLLPTNRVKSYTASVTLGAIVNIIFNVPFIHLWGLNGAMFSTVLSELTVIFYQLWSVKKLLNFKILFKDSWKYLVGSVVMFSVVFYMNIHYSQNWLMLISEVLIGVIIYFMSLLLLKPRVFQNGLEILNNLKHDRRF